MKDLKVIITRSLEPNMTAAHDLRILRTLVQSRPWSPMEESMNPMKTLPQMMMMMMTTLTQLHFILFVYRRYSDYDQSHGLVGSSEDRLCFVSNGPTFGIQAHDPSFEHIRSA